MTSADAVETSVTITNSLSQNYTTDLDDQFRKHLLILLGSNYLILDIGLKWLRKPIFFPL